MPIPMFYASGELINMGFQAPSLPNFAFMAAITHVETVGAWSMQAGSS